MDDEYHSPQPLAECGNCGRKFNPDVLARHMPICRKATKPRKVFDSSKMRKEGTEIKSVRVNKAQEKKYEQASKKKLAWRAKHQEFVSTIQAARGVQKAIEGGGPLPPPPPPTVNPDYEQCPYCSRRFNSTAAERHIPFCKDLMERKKMQGGPARAQYKPPKIKTSSSRSSPSSGTSHAIGSRDPGGLPGSMGNSRAAKATASTMGSRAGQFSQNQHDNNRMGSERTGSDRVGSGRALRTGRKIETYSDGRELGAMQQRSNMRKSPSGDRMRKPLSKYGSATNGHSPTGRGAASTAGSTYCFECGSQFPSSNAKFCCECGIKRFSLN